MSAKLPAAPSDLAARGRGRRFWKRIVGEYDCSPAELELLAQAARTLDELDVLRRAVAKEGATVKGSMGQRRAHPALTELRLGRGELRRLLDSLGIPAVAAAQGEAEVEGVVTLASRRATKAARARWDKRGGEAGS